VSIGVYLVGMHRGRPELASEVRTSHVTRALNDDEEPLRASTRGCDVLAGSRGDLHSGVGDVGRVWQGKARGKHGENAQHRTPSSAGHEETRQGGCNGGKGAGATELWSSSYGGVGRGWSSARVPRAITLTRGETGDGRQKHTMPLSKDGTTDKRWSSESGVEVDSSGCQAVSDSRVRVDGWVVKVVVVGEAASEVERGGLGNWGKTTQTTCHWLAVVRTPCLASAACHARHFNFLRTGYSCACTR